MCLLPTQALMMGCRNPAAGLAAGLEVRPLPEPRMHLERLPRTRRKKMPQINLGASRQMTRRGVDGTHERP